MELTNHFLLSPFAIPVELTPAQIKDLYERGCKVLGV